MSGTTRGSSGEATGGSEEGRRHLELAAAEAQPEIIKPARGRKALAGSLTGHESNPVPAISSPSIGV